jgi:general secretion pathway protein D
MLKCFIQTVKWRWWIFGTQGGATFGGSSLQDVYSALLSGSFVIGTLSRSGTSVTIGSTTLFFPDLVLLFSLLEKGSGFNIISNPKVLTLRLF